MTFQLAGLVIDGPPYNRADTVVSLSRAARQVAGAAPGDGHPPRPRAGGDCSMSGRPTLYTAEIAERILDALVNGRSLSALCKDQGMPPPSTVLDWVREDREGFAARYQQAREAGNPFMRS
jgi:hypothetical protein